MLYGLHGVILNGEGQHNEIGRGRGGMRLINIYSNCIEKPLMRCCLFSERESIVTSPRV